MLIRRSQPSDAHSISRIYVQCWQDTYLGVLPIDYLIRMSVSRHEHAFRRELKRKQIISFVAEDHQELIGFITGGYERNGNRIYTGEIYTLYVLKGQQRQGVGSALVPALVKQFERNGIHSMLVQVLKENPYRHFYEKLNGIPIKSRNMPFEGRNLDFEYYGWIDATLVCQ